jgi:hypothetical protein
MRILQTCSIPLGVALTLLILPAGAAARNQVRGPALAPDRLVTIRSSLITADRAEVAMVSGVIHRGKIEAVTEADLVLKVRPRRRGPWQMQVIATQDIQHLRLFHSGKRGAKARTGRTLGLLAGIVLAGPAVAGAARSEKGVLAWTAAILIPGLGAMAGERIATPSQETLVPIVRPSVTPPPGDTALK